jgi:hypothetical protein
MGFSLGQVDPVRSALGSWRLNDGAYARTGCA